MLTVVAESINAFMIVTESINVFTLSYSYREHRFHNSVAESINVSTTRQNILLFLMIQLQRVLTFLGVESINAFTWQRKY